MSGEVGGALFGETRPRDEGGIRSAPLDTGVFVAVLLLLALGASLGRHGQPEARAARAFDGAVRFTVPAGWAGHEEEHEGRTQYVAQLPGFDGVRPTVIIENVTPEGGVDPLFADLQLARIHEAREAEGVGYRVLHVDERASFGGHDATWTWYAMVVDPPHADPGAAVLPIVVVGVDVLVLTAEGEAWQVRAFEPAHDSADDEDELERILATVRIVR